VTFTKELGVGMLAALIVDATVIRVLLVPATMKLLGDANWWAPAPLRRLYGRIGLNEGAETGHRDVPMPPIPAPLPAPVAV
ncbi:MAG: hypothetical protein ACRDQZ_24415, partial [Mycobacteriales bacterium]